MSSDSNAVVKLEAEPETLRVVFDDSRDDLVVTWRWVRDHSQDPDSFDAATSQRQVDTFSLTAAHPAGNARIGRDLVVVSWPDDTPDSVLPLELLRRVSGRSSSPEQTVWTSAEQVSMTPVGFDEVINSADGLACWLADISRFGAGLVTGAPPEMSSAEALVKRIGYVRHTIFGGTWTLSSEVTDHADTSYGTDTLEPHTDGSYSHDGPGLQMFVCAERTGDGGESVLVDGFAAAEHLRAHDPEAFETLARVSVPGHYIEDGVHLRASRPTIRLGDAGELVQVTFNNYDRSPFALPPDEMDQWYRSYGAFHSLISDRSRWWKTYLTPGDVLILDNWRCLHGRMAYSGKRVFYGAYLNHEDLESSIRVGLHPGHRSSVIANQV